MSETREVTVSQEVMLRVNVYSGGDDTVVMLPGAGWGAAALCDIPRRVAAAGYRTVAVNPRGAAGSTGPVEGVSLHDLAADVALLVEALGLSPVHILGHAGGNRVARCLASDRPLPRAGHGLVVEQPDAVTQAILNWLREYAR